MNLRRMKILSSSRYSRGLGLQVLPSEVRNETTFSHNQIYPTWSELLYKGNYMYKRGLIYADYRLLGILSRSIICMRTLPTAALFALSKMLSVFVTLS